MLWIITMMNSSRHTFIASFRQFFSKKHSYNICTMSAQRLPRRSNIVQMVYKCFMFVGKQLDKKHFGVPYYVKHNLIWLTWETLRQAVLRPSLLRDCSCWWICMDSPKRNGNTIKQWYFAFLTKSTLSHAYYGDSKQRFLLKYSKCHFSCMIAMDTQILKIILTSVGQSYWNGYVSGL